MVDWFDEYPDTEGDYYDRMYQNLLEGKNADGSEYVADVTPEVGSTWKHYNGIVYTIIHLTNLDSTNTSKYPVTVVYQGENKKVWSKSLSDWHRSFKIVNK